MPTASEEALGGKLVEEVNAHIAIRTKLIEALARIKELEEKYEKPVDPPPSSSGA